MGLGAISLLATAITVVLFGCCILFLHQHRAIRVLFFTLCLGIAGFMSSLVFLLHTKSLLYDPFVHASGITAVASFFALSLFFARPTPPPRSTLWLLGAVWLLVITVLIPNQLIVAGAVLTPAGELEPINGPLHPVYTLSLLVLLAAALRNYVRTYVIADAGKRRDIRYKLLAIGLFILICVVTGALLPLFGSVSLLLVGPLYSVIMVLMLLFAILHHGFLDVRFVIQRGLIYTIIFACLVLLYVSIISFLRLLVTEDTAAASLATSIVVTVFALATVPYIDRYLRRKTDPIFFKGRYDYRQTLYELSQIQKRNVDWAVITEQSARTLEKQLRVQSVTFSTDVTTCAKAATADELCVPIRFDGRVVACVQIGPKRSGERFTDEDRSLVTTFAEQAAVAFEKARLFREVQEHSATLEQRVADRTADIERLQQAQEDMLFEISHNMQTPLTVLKNDVARLKHELSKPESQQAVRSFERSVDDVSTFTKRLLQLGKYQVDEAVTDVEVFPLSTTLEDLCEYFGTIAEAEGVQFVCRVTPHMYIEANRKQIEEILANIVSNAIKYRRAISDSRIVCSLTLVAGQVQITVEDNGQGISAEQLPRVFDRFYRAGDAAVSGSGLGLALTKAMVDRNQGTIALASTLGQGTTVTLTFPGVRSK